MNRPSTGVEVIEENRAEIVPKAGEDAESENSAISNAELGAIEADFSRKPTTLDELLAAESGSGVNNGTGPTGTQMICATAENTLYLRGTAAPSVAEGTLTWDSLSYHLKCGFESGEIVWICRGLDSDLTVTIYNAESGRFRGTVAEVTAEGEEKEWGSFPCAIPVVVPSR